MPLTEGENFRLGGSNPERPVPDLNMSKKSPTIVDMVHLFKKFFQGVQLEPTEGDTIYDASNHYRSAHTFAERGTGSQLFWALEDGKEDTLVVLGHGWFAFLELAYHSPVNGVQTPFYRVGYSYSLPFKRSKQAANFRFAAQRNKRDNGETKAKIAKAAEDRAEINRKMDLVAGLKNPHITYGRSWDTDVLSIRPPKGVSFDDFVAAIKKVYDTF